MSIGKLIITRTTKEPDKDGFFETTLDFSVGNKMLQYRALSRNQAHSIAFVLDDLSKALKKGEFDLLAKQEVEPADRMAELNDFWQSEEL